MQEFDPEERKLLLQTARDSIQYYLNNHALLSIDLTAYPEHLQQARACFVTLHLNGQLRGCIGSLQAQQPLIMDVVHNAYSAGFKDPRFAPLNNSEYPSITLEISVLSRPSPMVFSSEADLLSQLKPGIDGLILSDLGYRGTFLPSVWAQLPSPEQFLRHLKNKAGLPTDYWSSTIQIEHYTAELIA
jgi:AmmeMemoRadiSam system protein A